MKTFFPSIVGNDALCRRIGEEFEEGSFSHAYILEGARGYGKHTLALQLAMAAACENKKSTAHPLPCGTCRYCRRIASGNCPDVMLVQKEPDKKEFGVDVIRALRSGISMVPNDLDVKVYILEDAHLMNEAAQNAFLLTLEEPPPFVLFLLLCEDASALLETVRSRAQTLRLLPVGEAAMRSYLLCAPEAVSGGAPALLRDAPAEFAALISLSNGSIGRALSLLHPERRAPLIERRETAMEILRCLSNGNKSEQLLHLLLSFGTVRETVMENLSVLAEALRDLILISRAETAKLMLFTDREEAAELAAAFTLSRLFTLMSATQGARDALSATANVKITVAHLLSQFL